MPDATTHELLDLTEKLLESISQGNWSEYAALCDPSITAFEPEARGHLVEGLDFHRFYFDLGAPAQPRNTTISSPHVRLMGDVAVVCYVRLTQKLDAHGVPVTVSTEETRVWRRRDNAWKHVHFHRSTPS